MQVEESVNFFIKKKIKAISSEELFAKKAFSF